MIPIWVGKVVAKRVIKAIKYKIDLKKIDKYVKEDNETDLQVKVNTKTLDKYGNYIEKLEKQVATLKKNSHPSQEYICCRKCGCEIAKTKIKKRRK